MAAIISYDGREGAIGLPVTLSGEGLQWRAMRHPANFGHQVREDYSSEGSRPEELSALKGSG